MDKVVMAARRKPKKKEVPTNIGDNYTLLADRVRELVNPWLPPPVGVLRPPPMPKDPTVIGRDASEYARRRPGPL